MFIEFVTTNKEKLLIRGIRTNAQYEIDRINIQQCSRQCKRALSDCSGFVSNGGHKIIDHNGHGLFPPVNITTRLCVLKEYLPDKF